MSDEEKNRFDAISELRKATWECYTGRRNYEWLMSFTVWTGIVAFIGLATTSSVEFSPTSVCIVAIVVLGVHSFWQFCLASRNKLDIDSAEDLTSKLRELCHVDKYDYETKDPLPSWLRGRWSHSAYLAITGVLLLTAFYVTSSRTYGTQTLDFAITVGLLLPVFFLAGTLVGFLFTRQFKKIDISLVRRGPDSQ